MDRLHAMQLFTRVVDLGSFAAAAQQLNLAPSAVTRQIAALEAHLGDKLMTRSTRRLNLTSAGAAYLEKCRQILNNLLSNAAKFTPAGGTVASTAGPTGAAPGRPARPDRGTRGGGRGRVGPLRPAV